MVLERSMGRQKEIIILIAIPSGFRLREAGATRAWHISRELNDHGIKTVIVARLAESDIITGKNIIVVKPLLKSGFMGNLLFLFQFAVVMIRTVINTSIDKIIVRGSVLSPLFIPLKLGGKYIVYDFHGYAYKEQLVEGRKFRARFTKFFDCLSLKLADHIIVIREELLQDLPLEFQKKTLMLPNGVDMAEFAFPEDKGILANFSIPQDKKLVGFVGNWEAWIAIEDILESAKYFNDSIKIVIIGEGRKFEEYKASYASILFTGMIPHKDAIGILKKMDVCVCPYSTEPIAKNKSYRKIYEYLAAGKPIVISDADSREKFLKYGENVLMYRAGDSEDLAAKVKLILNNDELYTKMSRNNLEIAKQFTWKEVIARSGLIELLLGS